MYLNNLPTWDKLMKKMVWQQLGEINNKRILDFGSGLGTTADYLAENNNVVAIEPNIDSINQRSQINTYKQYQGSTEILKTFENESFDIIICHNVFEYAKDRIDILNEFNRVLKDDGFISIVKHNRYGRVMQMVVLLNNFNHASELLEGKDGQTEKTDTISYYEDSDIEKWCSYLKITNTLGMRTFYDLQQKQNIQKDEKWQENMLEMEHQVSAIKAFQDIAFFHHLIIKRK